MVCWWRRSIVLQPTNYNNLDVDTIPENGTWFQSLANGTLTINDGPNGLQKLDRVVELAAKHGVYLLLSLTNNWNPIPGLDQPLPPGFNPSSIINKRDAQNGSLPRNSLSNDYGWLETILIVLLPVTLFSRWYGLLRPRSSFCQRARPILLESIDHRRFQELY